ncbi:type a von willebrand factor domain-containing protein [Chrysochromulina tobinii]|uniref:Type a von willebrand factor domain-containing protein n=1 Tax=Chrysochromulina tobinii TaxID=1460289 RepID=A0A0M0K6U9_9EUKA|nr:type a von willebrand factor domain-containing protein [Chrysochromulina tobinii]|eukprot:KOO34118.1 type a von willebrand factor domain-containing protein [Chrysochromulina sp. CCMP291]
MRDFCRSVILSDGAAARSESRMRYLVELREVVVTRSIELRAMTDKKARQMKHKAVVDLLKGLQASGLSFHASALDPRLGSMCTLFAVPAHAHYDVTSVLSGSLRLAQHGAAGAGAVGAAAAVEGDGDAQHAAPAPKSALSSAALTTSASAVTGAVADGDARAGALSTALGARWSHEWSRSEQLYFRCLFRLTQLRRSAVGAHPDLSGREIKKGSGLLEHSFSLVVQQREALSGAIDQFAGGAASGAASGHTSGLAASRVVSVLRRLARTLQTRRAQLPEPSVGDVGALLTTAHERAAMGTISEVISLLSELGGAAAPLSSGEIAHLAPLISSSLAMVLERLAHFSERCAERASGSQAAAVRAAVVRAVGEVGPAVRLHLSALRWALHQALGYHGSLVRLQLVLSNTFAELFAKGFCTVRPEDEGGGDKGGQGGMEDDVEGTGMGEGEGKKDVSEELQEEGQIEGDSAAQKEEQVDGDEADGGKDERANEDEGVEMTNEWDGDMKDVEQPDKGEGSEDEEGDGDEEENIGELDEQNQEPETEYEDNTFKKPEKEKAEPEADEQMPDELPDGMDGDEDGAEGEDPREEEGEEAADAAHDDANEAGEGGVGVNEDEANEAAAADLERMQLELEGRLAEWQLKGAESGAAEDAWRALEGRTSSLSQELCEQLRLILEATVKSKLEGDYRTGKRISMRKVIPYIASGFRKDKIWLRRTKPSKRQYQILLCIDDSESMAETGAGGLACEALALLTQALTTIEAGQLGVLKFAESVELLHPFDRPFTAEAGAHMLSRFSFRQKHTHMEGLLKSVVSTLRVAREQQSASSTTEQLQLVLIVSDGRRSPAWGDPSAWVRLAAQEHILLCFVVLDSAAQKDSILDLQQVSFPNGKLTMGRWIDQFPFPFYLVVRELKALPQVLSDALRQWFEMLKE